MSATSVTILDWPTVAVAVTWTLGTPGSLLAIVSVVFFAPGVVDEKASWKGKQKSGLMITGKPAEGVAMENCGSDEVMPVTVRSALPVLQTLSTPAPVAPLHDSPNATPPGTWICGFGARTVKKNGSIEAATGLLAASSSVLVVKFALRWYVTPLGKLFMSGTLLAENTP